MQPPRHISENLVTKPIAGLALNGKKPSGLGVRQVLFFLRLFEILDGFSAEWGASAGDLIANTAGTALFIGQQLGWNDQRFYLKWSYHPNRISRNCPRNMELTNLGKNDLESILKDYNGQTYWLSGNIKSFLPKRSKFPGWLNVAVGYGGEGMLGATSPTPDEPVQNILVTDSIT